MAHLRGKHTACDDVVKGPLHRSQVLYGAQALQPQVFEAAMTQHASS